MSSTYQDLQYTVFPDNIQNFVTMLNMAVADGANIAGYQQAMRDGDEVLAQQYYNQITNANQKIIDATKINTIMDTCVALQRFYTADIEPYITDKQIVWENKIGQFSYVGVYDTSKNYLVNNFVLYNVSGSEELFVCIRNAPTGTAPTDTNYWRQLSIRGLQGESGTGAAFRYSWDSSQIYHQEDIVTYNNSVWACTQENSNQAPSSNSDYWYLIYTPQQIIYPFQSTTPTEANVGDIWFKIL